MTVRIGTGSSAVDPSELRVAGVAPSRIMLGTGSSAVEVWTATITVTPQAPTFLTVSPWYTLPTQAGVTYTVTGTPGYSQSVTITATPQAGYALAGQTSWAHTYGPQPRYTASGSGGAIPRVSRDTWVTVATHTVSSPGGPTSGAWSVMWRGGYFQADTDVRVLRNGVVIATNSREAAAGWHQVNIPEVSLSSGDSLTFQAQWRGTSASDGRYIDAWSWSLS